MFLLAQDTLCSVVAINFALKIHKLQIDIQYFSHLNFSFGSWSGCRCINLVELRSKLF